jgi:hypothetical protein
MSYRQKLTHCNDPLSQELKDIIVGTLLGDAWMRFVGNDSAFYSFGQSTIHSAYFYHVLSFFINLVNEDHKLERSSTNKSTGKTYHGLTFRTFTLKVLHPFASMFYNVDPSTGKYVKFVPQNISELLTARALAFWVMDDGYKNKGAGVTLCTECFTLEGVQLLKNALENNFGLICTLQKKNRLYISTKSLSKLTNLISPYMHSSLMYKLQDK